MLVEILRHTPRWVFVLFGVLLVLGYLQSKDRVVGRRGVFILPLAMATLSLYGELPAFGAASVGLVAWVLGLAVALWFGVKLTIPGGATYSIETQSFSVPGSWMPISLMMAIFFLKYAVGFTMARQFPITKEAGFITVVSLSFGFLSGLFLARALVIRRTPRLQSSGP